MWGLFWLPDRADASSQTCSTALSTAAQNRSCEHQLGAGTYRQISGKHFTGTVKLLYFTHSQVVAFDVANEYDFKSHNFQEFMNFRVIVLCSSFPRKKKQEILLFKEKKEEKVTACSVETAFYIMCLIKDWLYFPKLSATWRVRREWRRVCAAWIFHRGTKQDHDTAVLLS